MTYYVYILYSANLDQYYKGQTSNLQRRIMRHNSGVERYTRAGRPWRLVWYTTKPSRSQAKQLELKLKNLSKSRLKAFIQRYPN